MIVFGLDTSNKYDRLVFVLTGLLFVATFVGTWVLTDFIKTLF